MSQATQTTAKKITVFLNIVKQYYKDFTIDELQTKLKECHCPYYNRIGTFLLSRKLITKTNEVYNFIKSPIYFGCIEEEIKHINKRQAVYNKKYQEKYESV
jgi:hypothetical protein